MGIERRGAWVCVAAAVAVVAGACEERPAPNTTVASAPGAADAAAPAEPTPVLDAYAALGERMDNELTLALVWVKPLEAGLVLSEAPPGQRERTVATLEGAQGIIDELIGLSRRTLEVGALHESSSMPGVWAVAKAGPLLMADASRCFDLGEHDAALGRVAALARTSSQLLEFSSARGSAGGHGGTMAVRKAEALLDAGAQGSAGARAELRAALEGLDPIPAKFAERWERGARARLADLREEFGGTDGPRKLAEAVEEHGLTAQDAQGLADLLRGLDPEAAEFVKPATVIKPDRPGVYSERLIERGLARAEGLIPRVREALASEDLSGSFEPIWEAMEGDRTQVVKLVIGAPGAALLQLRSMDEVRRRVLERLE